MNCAEIESTLIDYHFAQGTTAELEAVHGHLMQCQSCARGYLELKHAIDGGAALGVRPSGQTRARLRALVSAEFRPTLRQRTRQWLGRPVPRYQVAMAASMLLLIAAGAVLGLRGQAGPGASVLARRQDLVESRALGRIDQALRHDYEQVDTARPMAVSLTYY